MLIVAVALHVQDLLSKFFEREACYNIQQEIICIGFARTQNCLQNKSSSLGCCFFEMLKKEKQKEITVCMIMIIIVLTVIFFHIESCSIVDCSSVPP